MKAILCWTYVVAMGLSGASMAQSARETSAHDRLMGAWHLVKIDSPGPDGTSVPIVQPKGLLIYTPDGHMSVQLMYPKSAYMPSNEYVQEGYEASFGSYDVDEAEHVLTHHVQGANTRDKLVGRDLRRKYQFTDDGHLIITSAQPEEHWSVTWEHY